MTRYEQGFMRKCAEYGVDGRRVLAGLRKRAGGDGSGDAEINVNPSGAGIGTYFANGVNVIHEPDRPFYPNNIDPAPTSYIGRLKRNAGDNPQSVSPFIMASTKKRLLDTPVSQDDVNLSRFTQAEGNAAKIYPIFSRPWYLLLKNLERSGERNQAEYLETGDVTPRDTLDRSGIENIKLTPEEEALLLMMQNSQVRNGGRGPVTTA